MKLLTLVLKNFKGIKNFSIDTRGGNVSIFGENATGKTTIFDAFNWLLFDKDGQNKKDFAIKPLTVSGDEIHHLNTEVEGTFALEIRTVSLKKVFSEKWTKKRGAASEEFTGHTTEYVIDGVPKPKKEYDAFIASIIDENIFKLLTSPAYFNEQLHWQDRRKILLEICGDISDAEVIDSAVTIGNKDMLSLLNVLNAGRTLDDYRKVIQARQTVINKELKEIPARIDEVQRSIPDISGLMNKDVLKTEIASLKKQQDGKRQEIARIQNDGEIAEQQKKLREVEGRIIDIQNKYRAANQDKSFAKKTELQNLKIKLNSIVLKISEKENAISHNNGIISEKLADCEALRNRWYEVNKREFSYSADTICPTCGQDLSENQVSAAREKAFSAFNLSKAQQLEDINAAGKKAKQDAEDLKAKNTALQSELDSLTGEKTILESTITALQAEIDGITAEPVESISAYPEYKKAIADKETIETAISDLNGRQQDIIRGIQSEVAVIGEDIASRERSIAQIESHERSVDRIAELEAQEKKLSAEYENLQGELFLAEEFIRTKVNLLESKINSKFKMARFRLFEQQVNGGINEICETTYNGVPYSGGLNNAARINVGLDIINTLSGHYNFVAPIFVDNREAVTELLDTKAQVISLVVSKPDKTLRVEYEEENLFKEAV